MRKAGGNMKIASLTGLIKDKQGQDMIEYSLLMASISIIAIAMLQTIGFSTIFLYTRILEAFIIHY
jgi:Flp pilus assembly pilin Flp